MKIIRLVFSILASVSIYYSSNAQDTGNSYDLSGTWKLTWANGGHGPKSFEQLAAQVPDHDPFKYVDAEVPGEIHDVFKKYGITVLPDIQPARRGYWTGTVAGFRSAGFSCQYLSQWPKNR